MADPIQHPPAGEPAGHTAQPDEALRQARVADLHAQCADDLAQARARADEGRLVLGEIRGHGNEAAGSRWAQ